MELHELLMFLHVLAAMVWLGGASLLSAIIARANRDPDRTVVTRLAHDLAWVGPRLLTPAAFAAIGLGILLTLGEDEAGFTQTWIWLSLVLVGVSMVLGTGYLGPEGKRIGRIASERGSDSPEIRQRMKRLLRVDALDLGVLTAALGLMVFKPGA